MFTGWLGARVSGHGLVLALTPARADWLPAASKAATSSLYVCPQASPWNVIEVREVPATNCPSR
jgi:hypothetical protein